MKLIYALAIGSGLLMASLILTVVALDKASVYKPAFNHSVYMLEGCIVENTLLLNQSNETREELFEFIEEFDLRSHILDLVKEERG